MRLTHVLRLVKLLRLLRLLQSSPFFRRMEALLGAGLLRILRLAMAVVLLTHWLACLFYLAAHLQEEGPSTWVGLLGLAGADRCGHWRGGCYAVNVGLAGCACACASVKGSQGFAAQMESFAAH